MPINVVITDDHPLLVAGIRDTLADYKDIRVTAVYHSAATLLKALQKSQPDVLLLDIQLPDNEGSALAGKILQAYPALALIILSGIDASYMVRNMMQLGCRGYLIKTNTDGALLSQAIHDAHEGRIFLDPTLKDQLLSSMFSEGRNAAKASKKLTQRERQILKLIVAEQTNAEIAASLFLSLRTVENHRFNILQKLEAKNTVGLVKVAMQMGLLG